MNKKFKTENYGEQKSTSKPDINQMDMVLHGRQKLESKTNLVANTKLTCTQRQLQQLSEACFFVDFCIVEIHLA